jgi:hypothetical protein
MISLLSGILISINWLRISLNNHPYRIERYVCK